MLLLFFCFFRAAAASKEGRLATQSAQQIHKIWSLPFLWQNTVHTGHHSNGKFFVCQKTLLEKERFCSRQNVRSEPTGIQKSMTKRHFSVVSDGGACAPAFLPACPWSHRGEVSKNGLSIVRISSKCCASSSFRIHVID